MNGIITTCLNGVVEKTGAQNRYTNTNANLAVNGFLFDVSFEVPSGYTGKWDFLKEYYINITERLGSGDGGAIALVSNSSLFDLLSYSDFVAGVSMESTTFTANEKARISGYIPVGYFSMNSRDALECTLNVGSKSSMPGSDVTFEISAVFQKVDLTTYICYQSASATGADQPYKNVLGIYYVGTGVNADAVVTDQIGVKSVNIESALALSNATGRFEFFTDFGEIYKDSLGISQDLSMRVPTTGNPSLLVVSMSFYPEKSIDSLKETVVQRNALLEQIRNTDTDKYNYLSMKGITIENI